jgi:hypothetical protein
MYGKEVKRRQRKGSLRRIRDASSMTRGRGAGEI